MKKLLIAMLIIMTLAYIYNEKQIDNCIKEGGDEVFCRYGGE